MEFLQEEIHSHRIYLQVNKMNKYEQLIVMNQSEKNSVAANVHTGFYYLIIISSI